MKRTLIIILVLAPVCTLLCGDSKVDAAPESTVNPTQPITP